MKFLSRLSFLIAVFLVAGAPVSVSALQKASPAWFDWAASRALNFISVHDSYIDLLGSLRADGKALLFADIDGLIGAGKKLSVTTEYGDFDASPIHGNLAAFAGYGNTNVTAGFLVTGTILELSTGVSYADLMPMSTDTNEITFRHGDVFFGGFLRVGTNVLISAGVRSRQTPLTTTDANGAKVFRIDSGGVQFESEDKFFIHGDVCGFRLNTQFDTRRFDLASLLYTLALGNGLGELLPVIDTSTISDSLDFSLSWRAMPVRDRLVARVGFGTQILDGGEADFRLAWLRGDVLWMFYRGEIWYWALAGGISYTDVFSWSQLFGYDASLKMGYRFEKGELFCELGYGRDYIDSLFRLPVQGIGAVKLRIGVLVAL